MFGPGRFVEYVFNVRFFKRRIELLNTRFHLRRLLGSHADPEQMDSPALTTNLKDAQVECFDCGLGRCRRLRRYVELREDYRKLALDMGAFNMIRSMSMLPLTICITNRDGILSPFLE
jgi:hypothetical protein